MKQMDLPLLMPGEAEAWAAQAVMAFLLRLRARGLRGQYLHPQCERVEPHPAAANHSLQRRF